MSTDKKAFDPTVSFMFFGTWVKSIEGLEKVGVETAYRFFKAIAYYSMYEEEPDFSDNPILYAVWATVEREIDLSIGRRKRNFADDAANEKYQSIIQAVAMNPGLSLRQIAELTGTDKNMVDRVKRKYKVEIETLASDLGYCFAPDSVSVSGNVNAFDSDSDSYTGSDYDYDSDTMGQDSGTVQNLNPLTCSLSLWTELPEYIKRQFTLYDRMRARMERMICINIDNTSEDAIKARNRWENLYRVWRESITNEDAESIIEKYLSTHEERPALKCLGDKYGRFVDGWNAESQEPVIVYPLTGPFPKSMRHNLDGIPVDYYRTEEREIIEKEERQAMREWIEEQRQYCGGYDDEELPF